MAQFLRPSVDVTLNAWVNQSSGTSSLFQAIDETDDVGIDHETDFVGQGGGANNNFYEVRLSAPTSTPLVRRAHLVRYRYRKNQVLGNVRNLQVKLRQGATLIASGTLHSDISVVWQEGAFLLTTAQAGNISDYSNLRLRFVPTGSTSAPAGSRRMVQIAWAQLRVPDWQPTFENEWGSNEDITNGVYTYTLDGIVGTGTSREDALIDLIQKKRDIAETEIPDQQPTPQQLLDRALWYRRWKNVYYNRKTTAYTGLKVQIQNGTYQLPPNQSQAQATTICDTKLARFAPIIAQADNEDRA